MSEILAVFRSRSQAIDCNQALKNSGVPSTLINTPKEAGVGCGLSVKASAAALSRVKKVIAAGRYSSFYGYMKIENKYGRIFISPMR
ncbi:MAG: DUF3343 domain-containing protein [Candidatus Coproplasma sp.]